MVNINNVYTKFGEVSEAAQLLETELGTLLFSLLSSQNNLIEHQQPIVASEVLNGINKATLGQLIRRLGKTTDEEDILVEMFSEALKARNSLAHGFYLKHGLRRNTSKGCSLMLIDLEELHIILLNAYKAAIALSGINLDKLLDDFEDC